MTKNQERERERERERESMQRALNLKKKYLKKP